MISVQLQVPARTEGQYGDLLERILAASDREERRRDGHRVTPSDPPEDRYGGYVLGWRIDSPTTTERRRNLIHHQDGRSIHTSELNRRHQDRDSRDRSSEGREAMES